MADSEEATGCPLEKKSGCQNPEFSGPILKRKRKDNFNRTLNLIET